MGRFDSCIKFIYLFTAADIVHSDSHKGCRGSQRHCFVGVTVVVFEGTQRHRVGLPRSVACDFFVLTLNFEL